METHNSEGLLRSLSEREQQIITETGGLDLRLSPEYSNLKTTKRLSLDYCRAEQCVPQAGMVILKQAKLASKRYQMDSGDSAIEWRRNDYSATRDA